MKADALNRLSKSSHDNADIIIKRNESERTTEIFIGKRSVADANYDEHGWAGLSLIEDMAKEIGKVLKLRVIEK